MPVHMLLALGPNVLNLPIVRLTSPTLCSHTIVSKFCFEEGK